MTFEKFDDSSNEPYISFTSPSAGSNKVYIKNMVRITDGTESEIKFLANVFSIIIDEFGRYHHI
ncbi:MAG: hypothetical protein ACI8TE_001235 [Francisella sp.]